MRAEQSRAEQRQQLRNRIQITRDAAERARLMAELEALKPAPMLALERAGREAIARGDGPIVEQRAEAEALELAGALEPDGREWTTIIHGVLTPDEARAFAAELIAAADGCTDEVTMGRWSNDA